jgi:hypothetical protein
VAPAGGLLEITVPAGELEDAMVTAPTVHSAPVSALAAAPCAIPTTFGTTQLSASTSLDVVSEYVRLL